MLDWNISGQTMSHQEEKEKFKSLSALSLPVPRASPTFQPGRPYGAALSQGPLLLLRCSPSGSASHSLWSLDLYIIFWQFWFFTLFITLGSSPHQLWPFFPHRSSYCPDTLWKTGGVPKALNFPELNIDIKAETCTYVGQVTAPF